MRRSLLSAAAVLALLAPAAAQNNGNATGAKMPMTQGGNAGAPANNGATNDAAAGANGNGQMNAGTARPMPQDNAARVQGNTANAPEADNAGAGVGQQPRQDANGQQDMQNGQKQNNQANQKPVDGKQNNQRTASRGDMGAAKTKIVQNKTVIQKNITRTNVRLPAGVSIAIGVALPATIAYMPVPEAIVAVVPEFAGYDYIVVDGQIVFVDPATYEIVYVMPV